MAGEGSQILERDMQHAQFMLPKCLVRIAVEF